MDSKNLREEEAQSQAQPKRFVKTRKIFRLIAGAEAWKRQGAILRHRLSAPLLRHVWQQERSRLSETVMLDTISMQDLERSKLSHGFLIVLMGACLLWAALNIIKGTAALVRFDVYLNVWLFSGIPLAFFAMVRLRLSHLSYSLINEEIINRRREAK
ncbi:hypothetical protein [Phytopseudomonas daroniae]|uniref:hypothetical protein n=1 Tax=Phytopseudomonas daroniae TaxID=2487519 RepID=UPI0010384005|nr:hypothetical protein [Pseudomonas daroniae]TBU77184.1 hypothetical protein DNK10_06655 [Pseudomonas daroniae]